MNRKEWIIAGAVVAALLLLALSSGANRRIVPDQGGPGGLGRAIQAPVASESEASPSQAEEAAPDGPPLQADQAACMDRLSEAMKAGDKEKASRILLDDEEMFRQIFYVTLGSARYLYADGTLRQELEGDGLVLTAAGTCFYGAFRGGKPEGACVAVQVAELDMPRYDFAEGIWADGYMEGPGTLGYRYFDGAPEGEAWEVEKEGRFVKDRMNGEITYSISSQSGNTGIWKMNVENGVTQLDGRWKQLPGEDQYQLAAQNDTDRAYVLTQEEADKARWVNLLVWEIR